MEQNTSDFYFIFYFFLRKGQCKNEMAARIVRAFWEIVTAKCNSVQVFISLWLVTYYEKKSRRKKRKMSFFHFTSARDVSSSFAVTSNRRKNCQTRRRNEKK